MAHTPETAGDPLTVERACETFGQLLAGRSVNVVGFVGRLLAIVEEVGAVHCRLESDHALRFDWPGGKSIVVPVERAKGKLRAACANLAVRSEATVGGECQIFGGSGPIEIADMTNGERQHRLFAEWANTMSRHHFSIARAATEDGGNSFPSASQPPMPTEE
jgi:hypothetical protein